MISPFEVGNRPQPPIADADVSDLLERMGRDVGGIAFTSLDEPDRPAGHDQDPAKADSYAAQAIEDAKSRTEEARLELARSEAFDEARRTFEMQLETRLVEERRRLDRVRLEFARDRQRFFAAAESQVVKLALAIARKILHRDAMAEGLALRSTVKAALARVQDGSSTVLRVPENECEAWRAMFLRGTAGKVEVVVDDTLVPGECVLETNVGVVELALTVQLEQIERGFGELMQEQGH